jgi:hypothetical protein
MHSKLLSVPMLSILAATMAACGAAGDSGATGETKEVAANATSGNIGSAKQEISRSPAYWWLPYRGGPGGLPFSIACPRGTVAIGLYGRSGLYIDQGGLICATLNDSGSLGPGFTEDSAGGNGGLPYYAVCPGGQVLVGVFGRSGGYVDQMGIQCAPATSWMGTATIWTTAYAGGGEGGVPFSDTCPKGYAIVGLDGRSGLYVDGEQPLCNYLWP